MCEESQEVYSTVILGAGLVVFIIILYNFFYFNSYHDRELL